MRVLFELCLALVLLNCLGFGIAGFISHGLSIPRRVLTLPLGYAASLYLYQAWLRHTWNLSQSLTVAYGVLGALSAVYAFTLFRKGCRPRLAVPGKERLALWALLGLVVLLASWPHMLAGWGNYWHSGNPDLLDPLYSRDIIIKYAKHMMAAPGGAGHLAPEALQNVLRSMDEYFRYPIHLQYTSMVFWSYALQSFSGIDVFLVQAVLNLLMLTHGVYTLMRMSMGSRPVTALLGAIGSSCSTFYFTTFINGHEGSMMFMAMIPYVLLVFLSWTNGWAAAWRQAAFLILMAVFLSITYPFPLAFFLLPLALHVLYTRLVVPRGGLAWAVNHWNALPLAPRVVLAGAVLAAVAGGLAVLWYLTGSIRMRSNIQFRSWRLMETLFRDVFFWGIWPSPVAFGQSGHVNFINLMRSAPKLGWPLAILSVGWAWTLYALTALWTWRLRKSLPSFYLLFLLSWPLLLAAMYYIISDPYFVYKFIYTTQFIFVIALAHGWQSALQDSHGKVPSGLILLFLPVWLAVNLANDVTSSRSLTRREYNADFASYRDAENIPKDILARTWVLIPLLDHKEIMLYMLYNQGLLTSESLVDAQYVLLMKGYRDVITTSLDTSHPLWENTRFAVYPNQTNNTVGLRSNVAVELMSLKEPAQVPFRWVSDEEAFNLPGGFLASYGNVTPETRYLRFCVESGPSFDYRPFTLNVIEGGGATQTIDIFDPGYNRAENSRTFLSLHPNARTCFWIPLTELADHQQPFHFAPDRRGRSILPYDERKLDFKLSQLGLTSERYDRQGLLFLTALRDIIPPEASQALHAGKALPAPAVLLGNGWYPLEQQGTGVFRWAEKDAEVLVLNRGGEPCRITLDVECGPTLVGRTASLFARDEKGAVLWSGPLGGRTQVRFTAPASDAEVYVIRLSPGEMPQSLPDDPRALSFRVFGIGVAPETGAHP